MLLGNRSRHLHPEEITVLEANQRENQKKQKKKKKRRKERKTMFEPWLGTKYNF